MRARPMILSRMLRIGDIESKPSKGFGLRASTERVSLIRLPSLKELKNGYMYQWLVWSVRITQDQFCFRFDDCSRCSHLSRFFAPFRRLGDERGLPRKQTIRWSFRKGVGVIACQVFVRKPSKPAREGWCEAAQGLIPPPLVRVLRHSPSIRLSLQYPPCCDSGRRPGCRISIRASVHPAWNGATRVVPPTAFEAGGKRS